MNEGEVCELLAWARMSATGLLITMIILP